MPAPGFSPRAPGRPETENRYHAQGAGALPSAWPRLPTPPIAWPQPHENRRQGAPIRALALWAQRAPRPRMGALSAIGAPRAAVTTRT